MLRTIGDYTQGRDNNFNLLRAIAATMVIFGHSFSLLAPPLWIGPLHMIGGRWDPSDLGVNIFFVASGFLIAQSFLQRRSLLVYLEARVLRIFPALWLALVFTVLVIGPLATTLPLSAYFTDWDTYRYFFQNAPLISLDFRLPGLFDHNLGSDAVNGSLWTLPVELRLYMLIALLGVVGVLAKPKLFNFLFLLSLIFIFKWPLPFTLVEPESLRTIRLAAYFLLGTFFYINRAYIPLHPLGVVVLAAIVYALYTAGLVPLSLGVFGIATAYAVLWFAFDPRVRIDSYNRVGDYSYGLYIYSFPVQQTIIFFDSTVGNAKLFIWSFGLSLLLAAISWHFLEKPALRRKGKFRYDKLLDRIFPSAWELAPIGIEQVKLSGPLLHVNRRLCEMLGYTRDELLKLSFRDITHPDDLAREEQLLTQLMDGTIQSYYLKKRYLHKSGETIPVRVTSSQILRSASGNRYRIAIVEDLPPPSNQAARPIEAFRLIESSKALPTRLTGFIRHMLSDRWAELNAPVARAMQECLAFHEQPTVAPGQRFGTR